MSDIPPPPPSPFSPRPAPEPSDQPRPPAPAPYSVPTAPLPPNFGGPGGPGFGGPSFGGGFAAAPRRSGKSVAALVLGIVGVLACFVAVPSILAIVFGILGLKQVKRSGGAVSGRGLAIAGLVLGIIGLIASVIFWVVISLSLANTTAVFDLEVGDCVQLPEDDDVDQLARVDVVECDKSHDAEVFATGELDGDEPYPGVDEITVLIETECTPEFEDYVGVDYDSSVYSATTIYPQEDDWGRTQQYVCLAFERDQELTESIKDSGR